MNIYKILSILFFTTVVHAAPGCRDNSWHLARPFDNKEDHLVANDCCGHRVHCQCPCKKLNYKGYCNDCGHFRYMQPWHIIRTPRPVRGALRQAQDEIRQSRTCPPKL